MKTIFKLKISAPLFAFIICMIFSHQGVSQQLPNDYQGQWKTDSTKISVRKKIKFMKYEFTTSKVVLTLNIDANSSVNGSIGGAKFEQASITKNKGNPDATGITYIVKCGTLDKLFANDASGKKTIELWLKPLKQKGKFSAEVRTIDGFDTFPMGECLFIRSK